MQRSTPAGLHLRAGLNNVQVTRGGDASLEVLRKVEDLLDGETRLRNAGKDVLLILGVVDHRVLGVLDAVFRALIHSDAIVQTRPRKSLQVLPVGVRAEDERVLHKQAHALRRVPHHQWIRHVVLVGHKRQRAARIVSDERLPQPPHHLRVYLVGVVRLRVHGVDHKRIRCGNHLLAKHRHAEVGVVEPRLAAREEGALVVLGRPHATDSRPRLGPSLRPLVPGPHEPRRLDLLLQGHHQGGRGLQLAHQSLGRVQVLNRHREQRLQIGLDGRIHGVRQDRVEGTEGHRHLSGQLDVLGQLAA
mmetsp:Transcript_11917/g.20116  ORF Transcript_11917/g.20116 Transcript_11917/m.20116 type:complete len:303 (-) Transcript_11917:3373-4281(-)